jgi:hypothetical protein
LERRQSVLGLGAGQVSCAVVWVRGRSWAAVMAYGKRLLCREARLRLLVWLWLSCNGRGATQQLARLRSLWTCCWSSASLGHVVADSQPAPDCLCIASGPCGRAMASLRERELR